MIYRRGYTCPETQSFQTEVMGFVVNTEFLSLTASGQLTVREGFQWDGPSGWITLHTSDFIVPSMVHDALYELMRRGLVSAEFRDEADELLHRMCRERGMWPFRAWYVYHAVRLFGGLHIGREEFPVTEVS